MSAKTRPARCVIIVGLFGVLATPVGCAFMMSPTSSDDTSGGGSSLLFDSLIDAPMGTGSPSLEPPASLVPDLRPDGEGGPSDAPTTTIGDSEESFGDAGAGDDDLTAIDDTTTAADDGEDGADLPIDEPTDEVRPPDTQSGTLTAGSFDDNLNYEVFSEFVSDALQDDAAAVMPRVNLGNRIIIVVHDERGAPVIDARVVVTEAGDVGQQLQPAINQLTGSDGRVLFMTEMDGAAGSGAFSVAVHPPDGSSAVVRTLTAADSPWEIVLPAVEAQPPSQLDLAFVVDATGSMLDELEFLKTEVGDIVASVNAAFPDVDQRYALIVYRDEGDEYVTRTFDFTGVLGDFQRDLSDQVALGGGDYPEAMHVALEEAEGLSWRERNTARVLFLIADAPPHVAYAQRTLDSVNALRDATVAIYPVAASGVADEAEYVMRVAAFVTLSQYLFLTDDSGVGNSHAEPHIPCYHVEMLDGLMVRTIASELSGEALQASVDEIIRTVGNPSDGVCMPDDTVVDVIDGQQR